MTMATDERVSPFTVAIQKWCDDNKTTAYTTAQAAEMVGVSKDTVQLWRKREMVVPSAGLTMGELYVYLYTPADIVALQDHADASYPGKRTDLEN